MAVSLYHTATEYLSNALTISRGSINDITAVGVYHDSDPGVIPDVLDFTTVVLADGTAGPSGQNYELAITGEIDVVSLIGPKAGADLSLTAGDYQRFVLVQTANEDIIRKVDTITVL